MFGKNRNRGKVAIYIDNCTGCGNCVYYCRHRAIGFRTGIDGRHAELVNPERCSGCGKCVSVCENGAIQILKQAV
ncbi:MAG: 4Fe-4S binding protein [Candidatus Symbiothrix sp.]|jgi:NAD-dependent dihydropyrimidine dehydrogenase PreA subunit|nr:4Fe-4S binding protein [Candidatus Symbiothrix sp.]